MPFLQGVVLTANPDRSASLRLPNGMVFTFHPASAALSNLVSIADSNGNTTSFQYQQFPALVTARIEQIIDPVGRAITLNYNSSAHVTSATDPLGRTVTYTYTPRAGYPRSRTRRAACGAISTTGTSG